MCLFLLGLLSHLQTLSSIPVDFKLLEGNHPVPDTTNETYLMQDRNVVNKL